MRNLIALAFALLLFTTGAQAYNEPSTPAGTNGQIQYNNNGVLGGLGPAATSNYLGITRTWVTRRTPNATDDTSKGYKVGDFWQFNGKIWVNEYAGAGTSAWQPQSPISAMVCDLVPGGCLGGYSVFKVRAAYVGNAFEITRASDSTKLAVPFDGNNLASWSSVDVFCASTTCTVDTWYDESGNGYDLTYSTVLGQPRIWGGWVGNQRAISFDGANAAKYLTNTSMPVTNRQNVSVFMLAKTEGAGGNSGNSLFQIGSSTNALTVFSGPAGTGANTGLLSYNAGTPQGFITPLRAETSHLYSFISTAGTVVARQNNLLNTGNATITSGAGTGLTLGETTLVSYPGKFDVTAFLIFNSALSSSVQQTVNQSLFQTSGIQPQVNDTDVLLGDSITCCTTSLAGPDQNYGGMLANQIDRPLNFFNLGFPGEFLSQMLSSVSTSAANSYLAGALNIFEVMGSTNDLAQGTAPNNTAATIFSEFQTACASAHASNANWKCIVQSPTARNSNFLNGNTASSYTTSAASLQSMLANASTGYSTFSEGFVDIQGDPTMGPSSAAATSTLYFDGTHPAAPLGTSLDAAVHARALQPLLQ